MIHPLYTAKTLLPRLIARKEKSAIINVSSMASLIPNAPGYTMYASSKTYMSYTSMSLNSELKEHNIDVLDYRPAFVETKMSQVKVNPICVSAKTAAMTSLNDLGVRVTSFGSYIHFLNYFFSKCTESFSSLFPNASKNLGKERYLADQKAK